MRNSDTAVNGPTQRPPVKVFAPICIRLLRFAPAVPPEAAAVEWGVRLGLVSVCTLRGNLFSL